MRDYRADIQEAFFKQLDENINISAAPIFVADYFYNKNTKSYTPGKRKHWKYVSMPHDFRTVLPNEIIFELDYKSFKQNAKSAVDIIDVLEDMEIPYNAYQSGSVRKGGIHIHLFFDMRLDPVKDKELLDLISRAYKFGFSFKHLRIRLWNYILDQAGIPDTVRGDGKALDKSTINFDETNDRFKIIRAEGGRYIKFKPELQEIEYTNIKNLTSVENLRKQKKEILPIDERDNAKIPKQLKLFLIPTELLFEFVSNFITAAEKNKEQIVYDNVVLDGNYINLPCVQHLLTKGMQAGNRSLGARIVSIAARKDGLSYDEAKKLVNIYHTNCSQLGKEFHMGEAINWLDWIYKQDVNQVFWTCALPKELELCDTKNCEFEKTKFKKSISFLEQPDALDQIRKKLDMIIVGEDRTKLMVFLLLLSKQFDDKPPAVIIRAPSATGKSHLTDTIVRLFPDEEVLEWSRITGSALDRSSMDLEGKILYVDEFQGVSEETQQRLRVLISSGKLNLFTTAKDESGNLITKEIKTRGTPAFITTSAEGALEEQMSTRTWVLGTDESQVQNKKVMSLEEVRQSEKYKKKINIIKEELKKIISSFHTKYEIFVPYSNYKLIGFPTRLQRVRRDYPKLLSLFKTSTYFHQFQRPKIITAAGEHLISTLRDYEIVSDLMEDTLRNTMHGISKSVSRYLDVIKEMDKEIIEIKDVVELTSRSTKEIRTALDELSEKGFLDKATQGGKSVYTLNEFAFEKTTLTTSAELKEKMTESFLKEKLLFFLELKEDELTNFEKRLPEIRDAILNNKKVEFDLR